MVKDDSREKSCGSTLNIHQEILKSENLLHKQGFVGSQFGTTITPNFLSFFVKMIDIKKKKKMNTLKGGHFQNILYCFSGRRGIFKR